MSLAFFEGKIMNLEDAKIPVTSIAFTLGGSVFEAIRVNWNSSKHKYFIPNIILNIERLYNSAKLLRMNIPYSREEILDMVKQLVHEWGPEKNAYIRITAYIKDPTPGGSVYNPNLVFTDLCIAISEKEFYIETEKGIRCCVSSWNRISDNDITPRAKSACNYLNTRLAGHEAVVNGYDNAILLNHHGKVSEAAESTIYLIDRNEDLITPTLTEGILDSINRRVILSIWRELYKRYPIQRVVDRTELYLADEVFICNTAKMIRPVVDIDGLKIGEGKVGKYTKEIVSMYIRVVTGEIQLCEKESLWV